MSITHATSGTDHSTVVTATIWNAAHVIENDSIPNAGLSAAAQDAISKKHTQNTDTVLVLNGSVADESYSGVPITGTAGEALTIGQVCYRKSDGKYWKAKADALATMPALVLATAGMAAEASGTFLEYGLFRDDDGWGGALTVGGALYVSAATGGSITQTAPSTTDQYVQCVGEAHAARIVKWNPNRVMVKIA
jgi:hypothetical protein